MTYKILIAHLVTKYGWFKEQHQNQNDQNKKECCFLKKEPKEKKRFWTTEHFFQEIKIPSNKTLQENEINQIIQKSIENAFIEKELSLTVKYFDFAYDVARKADIRIEKPLKFKRKIKSIVSL